MTEADRVWMPDTFFQNEKLGHFHDIIVPNVYVRIFPSGRVLYSIRLENTSQNDYYQMNFIQTTFKLENKKKVYFPSQLSEYP